MQISEKTMIPDILRFAPEARTVLDRYGLRGCGGPLGPVESLGFFAKAHDVPISELLAQLQSVLGNPEPILPLMEGSRPDIADTIYRPFFKAGIAVVLSLGAAWGAYLLLRIGLAGTFRAAGLHEINAHGHAQIFGWVGLFVMGFAYQAFPRFKHTNLACPRLALATFWLMAGGLTARAILEPLVSDFGWLMGPALAAAFAEVIAVCIFAGIIAQTWRSSGKPLAPYEFFIAFALAWFVVQAFYDAAYFAATLKAGNQEQLLALVASWQGPLREMQIHGFALLMVLGVSQRIFHNFYGLPASSRNTSRYVLICLNAAVLGEVFGLGMMRAYGHAWALLWYGAVLLLTGSAAVLVHSWRIFSRPEETDRSLKFMRAAYVWLFISLGMLVLLPAYQYGLLSLLAPESEAARIGFSHAYYGAARHAITVGFISLMIVGVAAKVVPTLNGVDVRALPRLWSPFLLINIGCALRVSTQILTDVRPDAYPVAGVSGLLEVLGLAIWGVHLWRIMRGSFTRLQGPESKVSIAGASLITAGDRVGDVLDRDPALLSTFLAFGFRPLANPLLRKALAHQISIGQACRRLNVDTQELLAVLNSDRAAPAEKRISLAVISQAACTTHPETIREGQSGSATKIIKP
jgi:hypothetical protein